MSGTPTYHYYLKDHLGNNRVVVNQVGTVAQQTDYYPFGMAFNKSGSADNKYLYNGKEMQKDAIRNGLLDWYDYGVRMYDATLGRFHTPDPLAEEFSHTTIYDYAGNNPISYIDYNGEHPVIIIGGAAIGLIEFGLLATGVVATGWILSKSPQGNISINRDLFAGKRRARNIKATRNFKQSQTTKRPKGFQPKRAPEFGAAGVSVGVTAFLLRYYISHKEATNPGNHEYKIENYDKIFNFNYHFIPRENYFFKVEKPNTPKIISTERNPSRIDPEKITPKPVEPLPRPDIRPEPEEPEVPRFDPLPIPKPL